MVPFLANVCRSNQANLKENKNPWWKFVILNNYGNKDTTGKYLPVFTWVLKSNKVLNI